MQVKITIKKLAPNPFETHNPYDTFFFFFLICDGLIL